MAFHDVPVLGGRPEINDVVEQIRIGYRHIRVDRQHQARVSPVKRLIEVLQDRSVQTGRSCSAAEQEAGPLLDAVPPVEIYLDRFGQPGQIDRAVQLKKLSWAEVDEHPDGDRLFSVTGWAAQDDGAVLPECGLDIIQPIRPDERLTHGLDLAGSQAPKPYSLGSADQVDVLVAADRIARYGQALSFPADIHYGASPAPDARSRRSRRHRHRHRGLRAGTERRRQFPLRSRETLPGGDQSRPGGASADGPPPGGGGPAGPPGAGGVVMAPAADRPALTQR